MRNIPTTEEKSSLPIINRIFPDVKFVLKDKPDVQSVDGSWGIEIVSAVTPAIRAALNNMHNGKEIHDKDGYKFSLVDGCGYIIKDSNHASQDIICQFVSAYIKKLQKLNDDNYSGFKRYAVLIYSSLPPIDLTSDPWLKILLESSNSSYHQFLKELLLLHHLN